MWLEIDDPNDKKPEDWVDVAKYSLFLHFVFELLISSLFPQPRIADPEAKKPDDWDEDAPRQIVDEDAEVGKTPISLFVLKTFSF